MQNFFSKKTASVVIVLILFGIFLFLYLTFRNRPMPVAPVVIKEEISYPIHSVIGRSVEGRSIDSYTYGSGKTVLAFVGGVHGGYEWNSVVLAYDFMDYLKANPDLVPKDLTIVVIPSANPDGVYKVIGKEGRFESGDVPTGVSTIPGRFNANNVDLNRNFDCKWQPESTWQNKKESAGTAPFSEPEAMALKDFISNSNPVAVVWWHSKSGSVYASQCGHGILPETLKIMNVYASASGYKAVPTFDAYQTTGDSEGWLASIGIPAITVELTTHEDVEFNKNLAGAQALMQYYGAKDVAGN